MAQTLAERAGSDIVFGKVRGKVREIRILGKEPQFVLIRAIRVTFRWG